MLTPDLLGPLSFPFPVENRCVSVSTLPIDLGENPNCSNLVAMVPAIPLASVVFRNEYMTLVPSEWWVSRQSFFPLKNNLKLQFFLLDIVKSVWDA